MKKLGKWKNLSVSFKDILFPIEFLTLLNNFLIRASSALASPFIGTKSSSESVTIFILNEPRLKQIFKTKAEFL